MVYYNGFNCGMMGFGFGYGWLGMILYSLLVIGLIVAIFLWITKLLKQQNCCSNEADRKTSKKKSR